MNFFGHAITASWKRRDPGFVLGAMLPDLANIIGARPPGTTDDSVRAGLDFHVRTDAVFHDTRAFLALQSQARRWFAATQLRRGTRLAVSHVGIEMLLDSYLSRDGEGHAAYLHSLDSTAVEAKALLWPSSWEALRFRYLRRQMRTAAASRQSPQPLEAIAHRLAGALEARPSLRMQPGDHDVVLRWLHEAQPQVFTAAPELLSELREGLSLPRAGADDFAFDARTTADRESVDSVTPKPASTRRCGERSGYSSEGHA